MENSALIISVKKLTCSPSKSRRQKRQSHNWVSKNLEWKKCLIWSKSLGLAFPLHDDSSCGRDINHFPSAKKTDGITKQGCGELRYAMIEDTWNAIKNSSFWKKKYEQLTRWTPDLYPEPLRPVILFATPNRFKQKIASRFWGRPLMVSATCSDLGYFCLIFKQNRPFLRILRTIESP